MSVLTLCGNFTASRRNAGHGKCGSVRCRGGMLSSGSSFARRTAWPQQKGQKSPRRVTISSAAPSPGRRCSSASAEIVRSPCLLSLALLQAGCAAAPWRGDHSRAGARPLVGRRGTQPPVPRRTGHFRALHRQPPADLTQILEHVPNRLRRRPNHTRYRSTSDPNRPAFLRVPDIAFAPSRERAAPTREAALSRELPRAVSHSHGTEDRRPTGFGPATAGCSA